MNLRDMCSMNDTKILRNLILENPDLPLLVFTTEESWTGEYSSEQSEISSGSVQELTLYKNQWLDKDDYQEELSNDLCGKDEYKHLSDNEYFKMIDKKVEETEFVKAIVVWVG